MLPRFSSFSADARAQCMNLVIATLTAIRIILEENFIVMSPLIIRNLEDIAPEVAKLTGRSREESASRRKTVTSPVVQDAV